MNIIVIGGGAGGGSFAARMRRLDDEAQITILEQTDENSIASCGIPYYLGDVIAGRDEIQVAKPALFKDLFNIDLKLNCAATAIDITSKTVTTQTGEILPYDKLVLSPGVIPTLPPIAGLELKPYFVVKALADGDAIKAYIAKNKPQSVAVVGGSLTGLEVAENMQQLGLKTALIELQDQVLSVVDRDMVGLVHQKFKENQVDLFLGTSLKEITTDRLILSDGTTINSDFIIFASGIKPNTTLMKSAGIALNAQGYIKTNSFMETSAEDIYACGDAVEVIDFVTNTPATIALAGPANRQGRLIADHIIGRAYPYTGTQGTGIIKVFDLTVAFTGNNEEQLQSKSIPYKKMIIWGMNHATYYPDATPISLKALYNEEGKILGAQAVGYVGVDKRIDVIATVMRLGGTVSDLRDAELCYAPPYSSAKDPVNMLGMAISNVEQGLLKPFFGNNFDNMTVIDVRAATAHAVNHLPNAINIPGPELRARLAEIPKDKPIVVHCYKGFTAYVSARILMTNGFTEVYSYAGGLQQYLAQNSIYPELKKS